MTRRLLLGVLLPAAFLAAWAGMVAVLTVRRPDAFGYLLAGILAGIGLAAAVWAFAPPPKA